MARQPDTSVTHEWRGFNVQVRTWVDDSSEPWDGDEEARPDEGSTNHDVYVEVELEAGGQRFGASSSLCSVWVHLATDQGYLEETCKEVRDEALAELAAEVEAVASGRDLQKERARQKVARTLAKELTVGEVICA